MKKSSLIKIPIFIFSTVILLTTAFTCSSTKTAMIYGVKWTGGIRTPLAPLGVAPGSPPYMILEDINFSGGFGEMSGDLSKYNFWLESNSLSIKQDTPGPNETLNDIWYSYYDSGVKSDGTREATITGRCYLTNKKLNPLHPDGPLEYNLLLQVVPNKPYHFRMNIFTTKKGTMSDLMVSGNAESPNGVITFIPVK
jgi:hypothetical protein